MDVTQLTTPDGRTLEIATAGSPGGQTIFFHHGTPGSVYSMAALEPLLENHEFFLMTLSRPGYGHSSRREGRQVASVVDDVRLALGHFRREGYVAVGWSGGGPHALACAALDAPRCRGAWSLAGVAPTDVDFDWTAGMGPENIEEFELARVGGEAYEEHMRATGAAFAGASAHTIVELFGGLLSAPDREALEDEPAREVMALATRHAFANGHLGFLDDDRAFFSPWGFRVEDVTVPVSVWYGDEDLMVPPTHGAWLVDHLARAARHHVAPEGHVSLVSRQLRAIGDEIAATFA